MASAMPQWKRDLIQRRRQQQQQGKLRPARVASESCGGATTTNTTTATNSTTTASAARLAPSERRADSSQTAGAPAVARNMRLEVDCLSLCSESDDISNGSTSCELSEEYLRMPESPRLFELTGVKLKSNGGDNYESDRSEELHYGPGIVNKLKSKYLNLTLRESNKCGGAGSAGSVNRFRRAASLEDLLDRNDEKPTIHSRKFTKRNGGNAVNTKTPSERYRNAARGNESMKRARSVETLLRCDASESHRVTARMVLIERVDEPVNDRVVLVDRSAVKIESRLSDVDRPRPINKPKRLKPVLAETERPPPDLVKTTMRIFESGNTRRIKPKGEVAAKVATFKTINDNMKAQSNQRKIVTKNGGSQPKFTRRVIPTSPKKTPPPAVPKTTVTSEINDGVVTEPIVRSVSSVVSKFRQFESKSPTSDYKIKRSPAPSPEPKAKERPLEINIKSPPITPVSSPRITSPMTSPKKSPTGLNKIASPVESPVSQEAEKRSPVDSADELGDTIDRNKLENSLEKKKSDDPSEEVTDGPRSISKSALDNIGKAGSTIQFSFSDSSSCDKSYLPGVASENGQRTLQESSSESNDGSDSGEALEVDRLSCSESVEKESDVLPSEELSKDKEPEKEELKALFIDIGKPIGGVAGLGLLKSTTTTSFPQGNESKTIRCPKSESNTSPPQKQIGIIRPLVTTKTQMPQQNLSNRELEKNLINRVKSIEQPTKVVVSLKSAEEIQPAKKAATTGGGLWDTKPWNQQNNTMVFNFSNRKEVPDYIENDGLIIRRRRDKTKVGDSEIIVLDNSLDSSNSEESEWEISAGPPSPCDVAFLNDNVLINGRSNLSRQPRNHKHRIQFDDTATRTFEYPSEASMLEGISVDGETSSSGEQFTTNGSRAPSGSATSLTSVLIGSGLGNYTPSKVDLASEGFELGVTRAAQTTSTKDEKSGMDSRALDDGLTEVDYLKPAQDAGAWGSETTVDLLF